jgi:hypothetical protein
MLTALVSMLICGCGDSENTQSDLPKVAASAVDSKFTCAISSDKATITQGEIPRVKVAITNKSGVDVFLVGSLDGSDVGWRYPKCGFEVLDSAGKPFPEKPMARCGNMNMLKTSDFVKVDAGGIFNPVGEGFFGSSQLFHFRSFPPGTYILRFFYRTSAKGVQEYFGDERMSGKKGAAPEIQKLYERVPQIDVKSNELRVTIQAKPEAEQGADDQLPARPESKAK